MPQGSLLHLRGVCFASGEFALPQGSLLCLREGYFASGKVTSRQGLSGLLGAPSFLTSPPSHPLLRSRRCRARRRGRARSRLRPLRGAGAGVLPLSPRRSRRGRGHLLRGITTGSRTGSFMSAPRSEGFGDLGRGTRVWHGRPLGASGLWLGERRTKESRPGLVWECHPQIPRCPTCPALGPWVQELVVIYAGTIYPLASHIRAVTLGAPRRDRIASGGGIMTPWQRQAAETRIMDRLQRAFYKDFRMPFCGRRVARRLS